MDADGVSPEPTLATALAALPDHEAALPPVLDAWRAWRSPRLARIAEALSSRVVEARGTVRGLSDLDRRTSWVPMAQEPLPANLGRLLPALGGASAHIARKNLLLLTGWPADPRLVAKLHELLLRPRVSSEASRPLWTLLFDVLTATPDPRTLPLLEGFIRSPLVFTKSLREPLVRRARSTIARVRSELEALPPMPAAELALLPKLEEQLGLPPAPELTPRTATLEQLRAAVYAAPDDDALRQVYADALQALGDPLGEFITLQLARGASGSISAREAELLEEHADVWAGALHVCSRELRFERGFPSVVKLRKPRWFTQRAIPAPEWSTIEELDVGELVDDESCIRKLLSKGHLPKLRKVSGLSLELADAVRELRPSVELVQRR